MHYVLPDRDRPLGPSKPKQKTELLKYDVILTTYHVCSISLFRNRPSVTLYAQTLALEWPDLEGEEMAKQKARKRRRNDLFVVSDSDDDRRSKKKKRERKVDIAFTRTSLNRFSWSTVSDPMVQNIYRRGSTYPKSSHKCVSSI